MMREPEAPAFSPVSSRVAQVLDIKLKFPVSVLFEAMFPVGSAGFAQASRFRVVG